ncbi:hypothetical protein Bca4012_078440 [Brassica carinata]|uniref:Methyltransferase n=1 Tax=Brassica carinata TaxID=52824 RepID=A0A8X7U404_BRACI|nr:hypothetical protein Bca52824_071483 [Brassica carinata]
MAPLSSSSSSLSPNPRLIPWSRELCAVNTFSQPSISSEPTAKLAISSDPNRVLTLGSVAAATSRIGAFAGLGQHYARCYWEFSKARLRYAPLRQCISKLPSGGVQKWPELWHKQLVSVKPQSVSADTKTSKKDTEKWSEIVSDVYLERLAVNWSSVRNVMDMNAGFGG